MPMPMPPASWPTTEARTMRLSFLRRARAALAVLLPAMLLASPAACTCSTITWARPGWPRTTPA